MPASDLPPGHTWRPPTVDDADAIYELVAARNTAAVGVPDTSPAEVADELGEPGFEPSTDGWLVHDAAGRLVGHAWTFREGDIVNADVIAGDDGVAAWLWTAVLGRAEAMGAGEGLDEVRVDVGVYRPDEAQRARVTELGFEPATTFQRMRIDFDGPPPEPEVPAGVEVRTGPGDESFRRDAHRVTEEAFAEHFGHSPKTFEEWHAAVEAYSTSDWTQLRVAYVDGEPVAAERSTDHFAAEEGCGYVSTVAVLPSARGRGLGKLLLRHAIAADHRLGRKGTILHVDSNNVTPALDLYESVGMRSVLAIDVWRRTIPVETKVKSD